MKTPPNSLSRFGWIETTLTLGALALVASPLARSAAVSADEIAACTDKNCSSCHNDVDKEGGLDLTTLNYVPNDPANFVIWVKVHDRVQAGEMPPKEKKRPDATEMSRFLSALSASLIDVEQATVAKD